MKTFADFQCLPAKLCLFFLVSFNTSSWRRMMMIMMRENHSGSCFKQMVKAMLLLDLMQCVAHSASW